MLTLEMSLKAADSGHRLLQPSSCFKNPLVDINQFQTNLRQLFMNIDLFNNEIDCFFYRNICRQ